MVRPLARQSRYRPWRFQRSIALIVDELPSDPPLTSAMLVGLAMTRNPNPRVPGLPDLFYADRIRALVAKGMLLAEGNLNCMGYSEVCLP